MEFSQGEATPSFQSAYYILFANQPLRAARKEGCPGNQENEVLAFDARYLRQAAAATPSGTRKNRNTMVCDEQWKASVDRRKTR